MEVGAHDESVLTAERERHDEYRSCSERRATALLDAFAACDANKPVCAGAFCS